jgi:hypothetical protein
MRLLFSVMILVGLIGCQQKYASSAEDKTSIPESATAITPQPIPPGFDFPADRAVLQSYADSNDVAAMRNHAWNIWAGLTTDSASSYQGAPLPIWDTWLATSQVFTTSPAAQSNSPAREFNDPSQFFHSEVSGVKAVDEANSGIVGFNKFDPTMVSYLKTGHPAPKASTELFYYTSKSSLQALNATWGNTPIIDRKIQDAPLTALELKPVEMWVAADGMTALPFWQGPNASTDPNCANVSVAKLNNPQPGQPATKCHPDPTTWTHCVVIDPNNNTATLQPATAQQFASANKSETPGCTDASNAQYGGINMLYHIKLTAVEAAAFNSAQSGKASAGDYMVFMAMHVNTKEIVDWTWQTFWWQGGQPTPDNYPGGNDGRTTNIDAPWTNYNMCSAYAQTTEVNNQGSMNVCFNPFLETSSGIPDGLRSNCVTCHGAATVNTPTAGGYPATYDQPIELSDPAYFGGATQTDFSWAIPGNAK